MAIARRSELYDEELAKKTCDVREIFPRIAVRDIRDACDIFMPGYEQTEHKDGYVSLEVAPELAERVCAIFGCPHYEHLSLAEKVA